MAAVRVCRSNPAPHCLGPCRLAWRLTSCGRPGVWRRTKLKYLMSDPLPTDHPAAPAGAEPSAAPASTARPARRVKKALLYSLAAIGLAALVLAGLAYRSATRETGLASEALSADAVIEERMTHHYGKYSAEHKGWLFVHPGSHRSYLMQVIHRAKIEEQSPSGRLNVTALYFLASGAALDGKAPDESIIGLFVLKPDPDAQAGSAALIEIAEPTYPVEGHGPLRPEDLRFEALSADTYAWALKFTRVTADTRPGHFVTNHFFAPHGDRIAEVAEFPARAEHTPAAGCAAAEAAHRAEQARWREQAAQALAEAASAAGRTAAELAAETDGNEDEMQGEEEGPGTAMCSDAGWTYKTGDLPAEGFVSLSVTGGGLVNGRPHAKKTYKLVFDPKSFSYIVPAELQLF